VPRSRFVLPTVGARPDRLILFRARAACRLIRRAGCPCSSLAPRALGVLPWALLVPSAFARLGPAHAACRHCPPPLPSSAAWPRASKGRPRARQEARSALGAPAGHGYHQAAENGLSARMRPAWPIQGPERLRAAQGGRRCAPCAPPPRAVWTACWTWGHAESTTARVVAGRHPEHAGKQDGHARRNTPGCGRA
jgi:hypothetical protein